LSRATSAAHNALLDLEELTQNELNGFLKMYRHLADEGRMKVREGSRDTDTPEVFGTKTSRT
jgi:low affinity Fe/Cu permease